MFSYRWCSFDWNLGSALSYRCQWMSIQICNKTIVAKMLVRLTFLMKADILFLRSAWGWMCNKLWNCLKCSAINLEINHAKFEPPTISSKSRVLKGTSHNIKHDSRHMLLRRRDHCIVGIWYAPKRMSNLKVAKINHDKNGALCQLHSSFNERLALQTQSFCDERLLISLL